MHTMPTYYDITGEETISKEEMLKVDHFRHAAYRTWLLLTMPVGETLDLGGIWAEVYFTRISETIWDVSINGEDPLTCEGIASVLGVLAVVVYKGSQSPFNP